MVVVGNRDENVVISQLEGETMRRRDELSTFEKIYMMLGLLIGGVIWVLAVLKGPAILRWIVALF